MHIQPCHIQEPSLSSTRSIFKSLSNMYDDHAYSEPGIVRTVLSSIFQRYLEIFSDIGAYSATLTGAEPGGKRGGLPNPFWKSKKVPWFWKKGPDCVHLWGKFFIENVVLRVSRRKNFKTFPCGTSISCVFL